MDRKGKGTSEDEDEPPEEVFTLVTFFTDMFKNSVDFFKQIPNDIQKICKTIPKFVEVIATLLLFFGFPSLPFVWLISFGWSLLKWLEAGGGWRWQFNELIIEKFVGVSHYLDNTPENWLGLHSVIVFSFEYLPVVPLTATFILLICGLFYGLYANR